MESKIWSEFYKQGRNKNNARVEWAAPKIIKAVWWFMASPKTMQWHNCGIPALSQMVELKTTVKSFLRFKTIFADEDIYKILDPNFAVNDILMVFLLWFFWSWGMYACPSDTCNIVNSYSRILALSSQCLFVCLSGCPPSWHFPPHFPSLFFFSSTDQMFSFSVFLVLRKIISFSFFVFLLLTSEIRLTRPRLRFCANNLWGDGVTKDPLYK